MKKLALILFTLLNPLLLLPMGSSGTSLCDKYHKEIEVLKKLIGNQRKGKVIAALFWQESKFTSSAKGISNDWGILQITPGFVNNLNIKLGYHKYKHSDAMNTYKSLQMFWDFQRIYNPGFVENNIPSREDIEKVARSWNGGQKFSRVKTDKYWEGISEKIAKLEKIEGEYEAFVLNM
jgi:hypothetical protein